MELRCLGRRFKAVFWMAMAFALAAAFVPPGTVADTMENSESTISEYYHSPTNGLGSWIWAGQTFNGQKCQMWRAFEIPATNPVVKARLLVTADNEFALYLDGRELGRGAEWRELFDFDLSYILEPGKHVLGVRCMNSFSAAGMIFGLHISLRNGDSIDIKSDDSWKIVPERAMRWEHASTAPESWKPATTIATLGQGPWWSNPINVNVMPPLMPVKIYFWQTGWFQITLLSVCSVVILFSLRLMAQLALHRKERWLLRQERGRIAREIHDDIGARMTQLVLQGEVAKNGLSEDSEMSQQLGQMCEEARKLLSTMDEILWALNPRRDTLRDFAGYVCNYTQEFLKPTSIQCLFEVDAEMAAADFTLPLRRSLLMAIKEALNNVVKHSEATEVRLRIKWEGQKLLVVVQDNGKGFDSAHPKADRNGLTNLNLRMKELEGCCNIASKPGKGCRAEFTIPLKKPRRTFWSKFWHPFQGDTHDGSSGNQKLNQSTQQHDPARC